jgi:hypothetical protein
MRSRIWPTIPPSAGDSEPPIVKELTVRFLTILLVALCALISGCATTFAPHQPSIETVTLLRGAGISKLAVGEFKLAPGAKTDIDRSVTSRAATASPSEGTFSGYLKASLISDLKTSGVYDTGSGISVSGQLVDAQLDTGMSTGHALISAHFQVTNAGQTVFDKTLKDEHTWESSIIGGIAIPRALNEYQIGYASLLVQLYRDPDFLRSCRVKP